MQTDGSSYYTQSANCTWVLAAHDGRRQRYSFTINRRHMGPGTTLQIFDASQDGVEGWNSKRSDINGLREYMGYDGYIAEDLIIEAKMIAIKFSANSSAEPALGPKVEYQILADETGLSNSSIRKIIIAGGIVLLSGYIILALVAWRRYKANETEQRQAERVTARYAVTATQNQVQGAVIHDTCRIFTLGHWLRFSGQRQDFLRLSQR